MPKIDDVSNNSRNSTCMVSTVEVWRHNLTKRTEKLREALLIYLVNKEDVTANEINQQLPGIKQMFDGNEIPPPLLELESTLQTFRSNKSNAAVFLTLIHLYETLPSVVQFDEVEPPPFDSILQIIRRRQ
jgi:hypothetical protein